MFGSHFDPDELRLAKLEMAKERDQIAAMLRVLRNIMTFAERRALAREHFATKRRIVAQFEKEFENAQWPMSTH